MLRKYNLLRFCLCLVLIAGILGCSGAAPTSEVEMVVQTVVVEKAVEVEREIVVAEATAAPAAGARPDQAPLPQPGRMIIKNGEITLEVENTDVAIDRVTQIVSDFGGYIISSQTFFKNVNEVSYKYATLNIGIPSGDFEVTLRRLREIAERVLNESASGQDVTDEYVDLESRLENLKATRDRIREFLDQAKTVEEALKVNDQLSKVEEEIETVQGRMNYLSDRAAFSTILISLEPVIPPATPTMTPTPWPTPTPTPWEPGKTLQDAGSTLGSVLRWTVEALIYFGVVCVPFLIPLGFLVWIGWRLRKRFIVRRKAARSSSPPVAKNNTPEI